MKIWFSTGIIDLRFREDSGQVAAGGPGAGKNQKHLAKNPPKPIFAALLRKQHQARSSKG